MNSMEQPQTHLSPDSDLEARLSAQIEAAQLEPQEFKTQPSSPFLVLSKPWFLILAFLVAVGVLAGTAYFISQSQSKSQIVSPASNAQPQAMPTIFKARISYLMGSAWKIVDGRKVELKEEDILSQNDTISTDKDTRLVMEIDDGSIIRLGDNTQITLSTLEPSLMKIDENKGQLFARVKKDPNHQFIVASGKITVQSLGTAFSVENNGQVNVKVFESQVKIAQPDQQETKVSENQQWQENKQKVEKIADAEIAKDKFLTWSLENDTRTSPKPDPTVEPTAKPAEPTTKPTAKPTAKPEVSSNNSGSIKLSGSAADNGINFNWQVSDLDVSKGFKLVKNQSGNPVYPGDTYIFFENGSTRSYFWDIKDGGTWHFRVCQYNGSGCSAYSNDITVTAPKVESSTSGSGSVKSISMNVEKQDGGKARVTWNLDGNSSLGFKVVWGPNPGPTYPNREGEQYHYFSEPGKRDDSVDGLSGRTYYFRVCEYLGGRCGVYSNEVSISY